MPGKWEGISSLQPRPAAINGMDAAPSSSASRDFLLLQHQRRVQKAPTFNLTRPEPDSRLICSPGFQCTPYRECAGVGGGKKEFPSNFPDSLIITTSKQVLLQSLPFFFFIILLHSRLVIFKLYRQLHHQHIRHGRTDVLKSLCINSNEII